MEQYSEDRFYTPPPPRGRGVWKLLSQFWHSRSLKSNIREVVVYRISLPKYSSIPPSLYGNIALFSHYPLHLITSITSPHPLHCMETLQYVFSLYGSILSSLYGTMQFSLGLRGKQRRVWSPTPEICIYLYIHTCIYIYIYIYIYLCVYIYIYIYIHMMS